MDVKPIHIQLHTFLMGKTKSNYIFFPQVVGSLHVGFSQKF